MTVQIVFGALADPIREQLRAQGVAITATTAKGIQADADAITRLSIGALLTEAEKDKARQRFMKALLGRIQNGRVR